MAKPLNKQYNRWLLLIFTVIASFIFTGCESENLGVKSAAINGHVLDDDTNQPISDVVITLSVSGNQHTYTTTTDAEGAFVFTDLFLAEATFKKIEKYGYQLATESQEYLSNTLTLVSGKTYDYPTIKMVKDYNSYKGTLKAYPVDSITGKPLSNFTVTQTLPYNQRKSKTFETAADFRDSGWTNLEGGEHHYTITATGYETYDTQNDQSLNGNAITIGNAVTNMGTINVTPIATVGISGTLKLPGYVLAGENGLSIWAESAGKRVASYTTTENYNSSLNYTLEGVPVSAGTVTVKCKIRGYDVVTLKSNLVVNATNPGGVIAIGEKDFINEVEPITRDLKVIVMGKEGLFKAGKTATVFLVQGNTSIQEVQAPSVNYQGVAIFPNVPTGYKMQVFATCEQWKSETKDIEILEEGTGYYICPDILELDEV